MPAASPKQAVGAAAPWFILGIMLFSFAVRAVYVESCSMFTRGGVYRVVKEALGGTFAKLSVSALMFDYILTGPHLRRLRRAIYYRLDERADDGGGQQPLAASGSDGRAPQPLPVQHEPHLGGLCRRGHHLLLVAEHQGHRGVQRQGSAGHADHHGDGGDSVGLGRFLRHGAGRSPASAAHRRQSQVQHRRTGLPEGHEPGSGSGPVRHSHGLRPLRAGHERRGEPGAGQSRDRASQAQEPEARGHRHRHLQPDLHRRRHAAGLHADSHMGAHPHLPGQPDRRPGHVHGRAPCSGASPSASLWCWSAS